MNIEKSRLSGGSFASPGLVDQASPEADRDRVGAAPGLKLREEMPDVALDRLLREEEPNTDLAVHEAVRDQLQHLDLPGRRLLLQLLEGRLERDDFSHDGLAPGRDRLEPGAVLPVAGEDLVALSSVHESGIGPLRGSL